MRKIVSEKHEMKTNRILNHFMIFYYRIKTNDSAGKYQAKQKYLSENESDNSRSKRKQ